MNTRNDMHDHDQINPIINITVSDIHQAINDYDSKKGWFRSVCDQPDISKLRVLHHQVSSVKQNRYLNASESYALFSILVHSSAVQNSASSIVLQALEEMNSDLVALCRLLNKYQSFNVSIFTVLYQRLDYYDAIKANIYSLSADTIMPLPAYFEAVCKHTKKPDMFLSAVVDQCQTIGTSNELICDVIEKILDKKIDSYKFWNQIRHSNTVDNNNFLNVGGVVRKMI